MSRTAYPVMQRHIPENRDPLLLVLDYSSTCFTLVCFNPHPRPIYITWFALSHFQFNALCLAASYYANTIFLMEISFLIYVHFIRHETRTEGKEGLGYCLYSIAASTKKLKDRHIKVCDRQGHDKSHGLSQTSCSVHQYCAELEQPTWCACVTN